MRRRSLGTAWRAAIPTIAVLAAACAVRTETVAGGVAAPGVAPALVVERFLSAANARDYQTMGRLFGTRAGSVLERDPRSDVERRMFALASLLRHSDYALQNEMVAPGRGGEAVQIVVLLHIGERRVPVPFTVVRTESSGWLVEKIDIEVITAGQ